VSDAKPERQPGRVGSVILLLAILVLAVAVRVLHAGGFWIDEVFSAANAKAGPATFLERLQGEPHSPWPIYYFLLWAWQHAFPTVAGMKALSIAISVLGVPALYGLGRSLHGPAAGRIVAGLAAVNPLLAWYGGEMRMYGLLLLVLTGAIWAALRAERTRRAADGILFGLLASLSVYCHVFGVFPVLVLTAFVVFRAGRRAAVAAVAVGAAAAAPAIWLVAEQASHWLSWKGDVAGDYWSSPMNLVASFQSFFTAYALPLEGASWLRLVFLGVIVLLVGDALLGLAGRPVRARWLLIALVVVGLVGPWLMQIRTRMYAPRFALIALPPLLLLVAAGIHEMKRVFGRVALVGLIVVSCVAGALRAERTDWREVSELLRRERAPGSTFEFEGGNVIALEEWFGEEFRESLPEAVASSKEHWHILTRPGNPRCTPRIRRGDLRPTFVPLGPEKRILEDEAPLVIVWREP